MPRKVGDPSSKYGLNPEQFEIDIENNIKKRGQTKKAITAFLEGKIKENRDNYNLIVDVMIELRTKYGISS